MKLFDRILVAVGEGGGSDDLIRYARAVRTMLPEARFCFVHVLGWSTHSQFHAEPVTHTQARQRLEEAVRQHFGDADAQCLVIHGSVPDRILEIAAELPAGVILVGHDREHRGRRSLARRLAMQAPCSVWMKPAGAGASLSRVLAAIDYSEPSAYALSMAGHIARRAGSIECRALHVYLNEAAAGVDEYQAPDRARQRDAFDRFTAPLDTAAVELTPVLVEGVDVAAALNHVAKTDPFDLVVMGCRGQSASASTLLGSESEHVMMESAVPVLIAKRQGDRIGLLQVLLDRNFHLPTPPRFG
jgi:nucleotide-binding universal stress UspA family protein